MLDKISYADVKKFSFGVITKLLSFVLSITGLLACLMLAVARTLGGRLFAAAVLPLCLVGIYLTSCLSKLMRPRLVPVPIALLAVSLICLTVCAARAPSGSTPPDAQLQSVYLGDARVGRLSPAHLVPESDQLRLGSYVLPLIDPIMGFRQAKQLRETLDRISSETQESQAFVEAGSVLGDAYADILLGRQRLEHTYIFYPTSASMGPRPAIVFLHGWLGNFKAYVWQWSKFAEDNDFVIVCPTFGAGYWDRAEAADALKRTFELCSRDPRIDERTLYVAGLSNGAMGVTRAALHFPDDIDGLIYISPVIEAHMITTDAYVQNTAGKPILVIYGGGDRRVPAYCVEVCVDLLQRQGSHVQHRRYEQQNHFLFVSAYDRLAADIKDWMEAH